jgi:hypothetical protein
MAALENHDHCLSLGQGPITSQSQPDGASMENPKSREQLFSNMRRDDLGLFWRHRKVRFETDSYGSFVARLVAEERLSHAA